jgi:hypothetical protein
MKKSRRISQNNQKRLVKGFSSVYEALNESQKNHGRFPSKPGHEREQDRIKQV